MIEATDAELLRSYAEEKSEAAFAELVRRRIDLVYSVARRQVGGDAQLAEDVTQKVFTDLARKAAALADRPVLSGWLCRSAQFAATDVVRSERRRRGYEQEIQIMSETLADSNPASDAEWEKFRPVLDQAMNELADADRDAVALRFYEGRAFAEVGRALQLSEEAARKRVDRALGKLQGLLARRGVTSTGAALGIALANQAGMAAPAGLAATITAGVALSGAAGGGAGLGLLGFMSSKTMLVSCGIIAGFAIGAAVYEAWEMRQLRQEPAVAARGPGAPEANAAHVEKKSARRDVRAVTTVGRLTAPAGVGASRAREKTMSPPIPAVALAPAVVAAPDDDNGLAADADDEDEAGPLKPSVRVSRLNELVALTQEQAEKIAELFRREDAAAEAVQDPLNREDRVSKGVAAHIAAREQVRAVLMPEQQKVYDRAPQDRGGGLTLITAEAKLARLNDLLALTPGQKAVAAKVFDEEFESLVSLSPADRAPKGMEYRQVAGSLVRAILTPGQQAKYDATPQSLGGGGGQPNPIMTKK